jgi:hypothetical protein
MINATGIYHQKGKEYVQLMPEDCVATAALNYRPRGQRNPQKSYDKMEEMIMVCSGHIAHKFCEK